MVRSLLLTFAMLLSAGAMLAQSTVLTGKVSDEKGEALIGATVKVLKGTDFVKGTITDFNGDYRIQIDPGKYDLEISYTGYSTSRQTGVQVLSGKLNPLDITMSSNTVLNEVVVSTYRAPLIEQDKTQGGQTLTSDQIKNLPTRSVNAIVATTAGTTSIDGGEINIKGSRSNGTNYYIDGIRVQGSPPPVQDIEQLSVITGGLGAEYGDVTGGVISVITKGPASAYHGMVDVENSNGLDPYGWFLATANVSGPILKKKAANGETRTVVGFRLSGQFKNQKDSDPPATSVFHAKESVLANLDRNPLRRNGTFISNSAEFLTNDSIDVFKYNPNQNRRDIDITGKLDFKLTEKIDFSITGTYADVQDRFNPTDLYPTWSILNSQNNPTNYSQRYRGIARFRHRLGNSDDSEAKANSNKVSISNASYQIQVGFERGDSKNYDPRFKQNYFDYGYIGRFNFNYVPVVGPNDAGTIAHIGNREQFTGFEAGYINAAGKLVVPNGSYGANGETSAQGGLVAYNQFADLTSYPSYVAKNGLLSSTYDDVWGGMYANINTIYNRSTKSESDILTITANSSFELKLGKTGTHSIQFGLMNEQRTLRSYVLAPFGLWNLGEQSINNHLNGLDTTKVIGKIFVPFTGDSVNQYASAYVNFPEKKFYREVRAKIGKPLDEWVNINSLTPEQLTLSMFAPRELTEQGYVSYYGYDYLGNKTASGVTFNDFFTARDENGIRTQPVAPLQPLYQAAFIKDKFTFNKMIFSLGLRVERFDLNTKVMRDQYSLYQIMSAKDYFATVPGVPNRPGTIGDNFKVYVESPQELGKPKAFRDGNTWYFADGRQANDGNVIFGGGVVTPLLLDSIAGDDILDSRFNPNTAFQDYKPQVNFLPRLAFSFPISKDANFFAHYDVLVQRPPSNWQVTPLDYQYFYTAGRTPTNNANLLPEKVVDYEVGFQQRLNQNSAIKFSAYYRELRNMIQRRTVLYVPTIGRYDTYGNIDFGTVKGFTLQYDLRRIQNTELRLAYTLQFADGTGSDANSQRGLTSRGNIRSLFPLNFDERHNIQAIIDYRFDNGKAYNGPRIFGKDILADFGANMQIAAVSGRPYTAKIRSTRFGGEGTSGAVNGSRLPWRLNIDLRLDKTFTLTAKDKKPMTINVYFRVSNLLNRLNVVGVYAATGDPKNDGYLASSQGLSELTGVQPAQKQAYLNSYSWILNNPNNYAQPRRLYIGASLGF
jgi:outer membrane receptor for ferrienterochelin and colicin